MDAVTMANYLCNGLGLDTITMATSIACAMDLFEDGIITLGELSSGGLQ